MTWALFIAGLVITAGGGAVALGRTTEEAITGTMLVRAGAAVMVLATLLHVARPLLERLAP